MSIAVRSGETERSGRKVKESRRVVNPAGINRNETNRNILHFLI